MTSIKLRVENLVKKYGDFTAVRGISFDVMEGEVVALLGPSGCGKTTTLKCIAGLEKPTSGNIYIDGELVNDLEPWERNVRMVFQSYALYPNMRAYDIIALPLKVQKRPEEEIKRRVYEVAEMVKISHVLDHKPGELSGGERQRVAMARALIMDAKLYLLDEPLTNLDAKLRIMMRSELRRILKELKVSVVYSSPDCLEVMSIADRIAVMNDGQILQFDKPLNVYNDPKNLFVATFVGYPPMNIIKNCIITSKGDKVVIRNESGSIELELPNKNKAGIVDQTMSNIAVGFRPEHVMIQERNKGGPNTGRIILIEEAPPDSYLHVMLSDGTVITVSIPQSELRWSLNDLIMIDVSSENVYLFDPKTGERI